MGRCDLVANKWPLPTGGIVAEPDFFHLIGDSMADKFCKVKHTGVIMGREFWGFWIWRADGASGGHPNRLPASPNVQYTREWGEVGWGRVTLAMAVMGAQRSIRGWGQVGGRRYARISGGVGIPGG